MPPLSPHSPWAPIWGLLMLLSAAQACAQEPAYLGEACWEKVWDQSGEAPGNLRLHVLAYGQGSFSVNGRVDTQVVEAGVIRQFAALTYGTATRFSDRVELALNLSSVFSRTGPSFLHAVLDPTSLGGTFKEQVQDVAAPSGQTVTVQRTGTLTRVPCLEELTRSVYADGAALAASPGWVEEGSDEVVKSSAVEAQGGAFEGDERIVFDYVLEEWWAGFGLAFSGWLDTLDVTGFGALRLAYQGPVQGHSVTVSLGYRDPALSVTLSTLPGVSEWTLVALEIPAPARRSGLASINFVVGGEETGTGRLSVDAIQLVGYRPAAFN